LETAARCSAFCRSRRPPSKLQSSTDCGSRAEDPHRLELRSRASFPFLRVLFRIGSFQKSARNSKKAQTPPSHPLDDACHLATDPSMIPTLHPLWP
jgi:hypothetical protein